jgi:hypothetical protein
MIDNLMHLLSLEMQGVRQAQGSCSSIYSLFLILRAVLALRQWLDYVSPYHQLSTGMCICAVAGTTTKCPPPRLGPSLSPLYLSQDDAMCGRAAPLGGNCRCITRAVERLTLEWLEWV